MSDIKTLKQEAYSYLNRLINEKSELVKAILLFGFAIYLTSKFTGAFDSSQGYDIRGEFCGYLVIMSFFVFLYISCKLKERKNLKLVSFLQLMLSLVNFLVIKSLSTILLLKILVLFLTIWLFLVLLREIKNRG